MIKQTVLKTTAAVLGAGLVSYLGTLAVPMLVLLGVMLLDYITGMIKAYIRAELNSKFGIKGILKKPDRRVCNAGKREKRVPRGL